MIFTQLKGPHKGIRAFLFRIVSPLPEKQRVAWARMTSNKPEFCCEMMPVALHWLRPRISVGIGAVVERSETQTKM